MQPFSPWQEIQLVGDGVIRGVTLVLPTEQVRELLPWGLELSHQTLTPRGTHPVVMFFQDMFRAHMNIPTLIPQMTYREHILGVPYVEHHSSFGPCTGPFSFMPNLYLDNWEAIVGGRLWWGYAKRFARFDVSTDRYTAVDENHRPIVSLDYEPTGPFVPVHDMPHFAPWCRPEDGVMVQPLISMLPLGMGPGFVCSDFDKVWSRAEIRPLKTRVHVHQSFVPGLPAGAFPRHGEAPGIDVSPIGSFEVRAPWHLSLPYLPEFSR